MAAWRHGGMDMDIAMHAQQTHKQNQKEGQKKSTR
jgi:hypothetical protein